MPTKIEPTTEDFQLPEDALCLGPNGWVGEKTQLDIQGAPLQDALEVIWHEQQGLLGFGEMVFYQVNGTQGFIVFHPQEDDEDDA